VRRYEGVDERVALSWPARSSASAIRAHGGETAALA